MRKKFSLILFVILACSCEAQVSRVVEKSKVNWNDYDFLFEEVGNSEFKEAWKFLEDVEMYEITYMSDGLKIESFAAIPKGEGKHPVIICNRGGNRDFGALQLFKGDYRCPVAYFFSKMASKGYIVMGCNYRGCGNSEGSDEFGGNDVNDILNLIEVTSELPKADTSKIGMYG